MDVYGGSKVTCSWGRTTLKLYIYTYKYLWDLNYNEALQV